VFIPQNSISFDCHQDDDHVTSISERSDAADREPDRQHKVMGKTST